VTQRKRRTYVLVIVLGIGALAIDRLVLRPGAAPADARAQDAGIPASTTAVNSSSTGTLTIPELPFPRDLPPLGSAEPFRDLFSRNAAQRHAADEGTENNSPAANLLGPSDSASFLAPYRLEAVMAGAGLEIAVVNGVWLRVGESIGECKLVSIKGTQAHFECRNDEAVLDLRDSAARQPSGR
jgi:hypothetical protein